MSERKGPARTLVLDTSVAVKWYLPEELHDEAIELLRRAEAGELELSAPSTIQPEFFNALWQQHRRGGLPLEEVRSAWGQFVLDPVSLYAPEDLMPRAVEIAYSSGIIVYDALFLALAEETGTIMVTADGKLLRSLENIPHSRLAHPLAEAGSLISGAD